MISIIMPACNEAKKLDSTMTSAVAALGNAGLEYEIILVDDGSTDSTYDKAVSLTNKHKDLRVFTYRPNRGKGHALKYGFQFARGEVIVFLDSDGDLPAYQVPTFLDYMQKNEKDILIGSKRHPSSKIHIPVRRRVLSIGYSMLLKSLFNLNVKDTQTGLKVFRREVLEEIMPKVLVKQYAFDIEILANARKLGYSIAELPVELRSHLGSKVDYKAVWFMFVDTLAVFYRMRILHHYDKASDFNPGMNQVSIGQTDDLTGLTAMGPRVSIVIACAKINSYTEECVKHCLLLDYPNYEVLVLPDMQPDHNLSNVSVIPTGHVGPSEKRDMSVKYATGEILAFIDDDAYPDVNWLREAVKYFQEEVVGAVCGPAVTPPQDGNLRKASGLIYSSFLGSGSLRFRYIPQPKREVDDYPSCNLIVRKSTFQEAGGFSTHFWPGEDTKFCLDIVHRLNKKIIYAPDILVYHHRRSLFRPHLKQVWSYAVHRGYFAKKYPQTSLRFSYFIPSLFSLGVIVGGPLSYLVPLFRVPFLSVIALYIALVLVSSVQSKNIRLIPLVFLGTIATHLTYGIGFIKGILTRELTR